MNAVDLPWVPSTCKLLLVFDPLTGEWEASLRLRDDYLGYLVNHERARDLSVAILRVRDAFRAGREDPLLLGPAQAGYFREALSPTGVPR